MASLVTMVAAEEEERATAVHLWVCDTEGGVHVLCHVTSTPPARMIWREVDGQDGEEEGGGFSHVVGGANSTVCAVRRKDNELFVRDGTSFSSPLGKKWLPTSCRVSRVTVGDRYIAVLIAEEGGVLIGNISLVRSKTFCPIKWEEICNSPPTGLAHIAMTTDDVLFGVAANGSVYGCYGIRDEKRPLNWDFLTNPPISARRGGFLSSLFGGGAKPVFFDHVTPSDEGVWCYAERNHEVWQLLIRDLLAKGKTTRQTSWAKYALPDSAPKLTHFACHPQDPFTLYGLSADGMSLLKMSVDGAQGSVLEISDLPFHGCGDIVMATVSCCLVSDSDKGSREPVTPSIYPKLPKKVQDKICCENGTCSFCLKRSSLTTTNTTGFAEDLYTRENYRQQLKAFRREERRGLDQSYNTLDFETATKKLREDTDFSYLVSCHQVTPPRTRRRRDPITYKLIRDIPAVIDQSSSVTKMMPKEYTVSIISIEEINQKYHHSFELEESVLNPQPNPDSQATPRSQSQATPQSQSQTTPRSQSQATPRSSRSDSQATPQSQVASPESNTETQSPLDDAKKSQLVIGTSKTGYYYTAKTRPFS